VVSAWPTLGRGVEPQVPEAAEHIIAAILGRLVKHGGPFVVAVDGGSGAGKSTLAASVAAALGASVVQADDFFSSERTGAEWDRSTAAEKAEQALDWRRLRAEALEPLHAGRQARWHPFDFPAYRYATGSGLATEVVVRPPTKVIVLEGIYCCRPELSDLIDLSVLVQAPTWVRQHRHNEREARDESEWHRRWDEAEDHYFAQVRPPQSYDLVVSTDIAPPSDSN
jgi:uridine kinase